MTVFTQLSVGAFAAIWLLQLSGAFTRLGVAALTSLLVAALALAASTLHLGRPIHAYRALKMWRRSWLSREVLLFSAFSAVASLYAGGLCGSVAGRPRPRRVDGDVRLRRRHGERLHLPRALASGVEHAADARPVQPDGADARPAVRGAAVGAGRRAGCRPVASAWPAAQFVVLALKFFSMSGGDTIELQASSRLLATTLRRASHRPRRPARARRHRAAAVHVAADRCCGSRCVLALAAEIDRPLSVLRQRRSQAPRGAVPRKRGRVTLKRAPRSRHPGRIGTPTRTIRSPGTPPRSGCPIAGCRRRAATARSAAACSSA